MQIFKASSSVKSAYSKKEDILETSAKVKAEKQTSSEIRNISTENAINTLCISGSENSEDDEEDYETNSDDEVELRRLCERDFSVGRNLLKYEEYEPEDLQDMYGEELSLIKQKKKKKKKKKHVYMEIEDCDSENDATNKTVVDPKEATIRIENKESEVVSMEKKGMKRIPKREKM